MKLTTLILITAILQVSANTYAQRISLSEKNAPLSQVFDQIRAQTGYDFFVTTSILKEAKPVTITVKDEDIAVVLKKIFDDQPFEYSIDKKSVVISKKKPFLIDKVKTPLPSNITIKGKIADETGQPLVGATIRVMNGKSTLTDSKGEFSISDVDENAKVEISYIGYEKLILLASSDLNIIKLKKSESKLDEIQIIAYGTTTQRLGTGSVTKVTAKEIENQPVTNVMQALEGRVAGLVVSQTSGIPGTSMKIQVRGQNSLPPNTTDYLHTDNPLIIIDGVPFGPQNFKITQYSSIAAGFSSDLGVSALNTINPSDIESIEVLKDADATSIYGSRGANGVILITTKKGMPGSSVLNTNVWSGQSKVTRSMEMMNTQEYLQMRREALKNDGLPASSNPSDLGFSPDLTLFDQTKDTDWKKAFFGGTAQTTDANINLSGGSKGTTFLLGTGYHRETYVYPGPYSDNRMSLLVNLHHNSTNGKFNIDFNTNNAYEKNNSSSNISVNQAFTLPPNSPDQQNLDGSLVWSYKGIDLGYPFGQNPFAYQYQTYSIKNYNLNTNLKLDYQIINGLNIRSNFGYNKFSSDEETTLPIMSQDPALHPTSRASFGTNNIETWIIEPQIEYKTAFKQAKFNMLIGSTFQKNTNQLTSIEGSNYLNDNALASISGASTTTSTGSYSLYKYNGVFGRLNVNIEEKYILNISGRRDGSSRFGPGKQFGNFGAIGGAWLFSEESYVKDHLSFISYGKLRASYGTAGNDNIGNYQYINSYSSDNSNPYQGSPIYKPINLYNPNFRWASTKKIEAGVELGFLKDRLFLNVTRYQSKSGNQLVQYLLPAQTGFTQILVNAPYEVTNYGWEISISTTNIKSSSFIWRTDFNLTLPTNKLSSFPGLANSPYYYRYVVGQPITGFKAFKFAGVNQQTGLYQYYTADGKITSNPAYGDQFLYESPEKKFYGGLSNIFTYRQFELSFFLQFVKQNGYNYLADVYNGLPVGSGFNLPKVMWDRWQVPGDQSSIQKFTTQYGDAYNAQSYLSQSNGVFSDASFIRLKTASIAYNLKAFVEKYGIKSLKIFINAENLLTVTAYKGSDPETQSLYGLPPLRTITAGINLGL